MYFAISSVKVKMGREEFDVRMVNAVKSYFHLQYPNSHHFDLDNNSDIFNWEGNRKPFGHCCHSAVRLVGYFEYSLYTLHLNYIKFDLLSE